MSAYQSLKRVYYFPVASITSYHKFSGLKQHKTFGGQKSEMGFRAKIKVSARVASLSGSSRGESVFLPFSASIGLLLPWKPEPYSAL